MSIIRNAFNRPTAATAVVAIIVFQLLLFTTTGLSVPEETNFIYLDEIVQGVRGTGKTVVKGNKISEFSIEVVGVIDKPGELQDFIIIRASGDPIEKSGGISQGMSGSPVYIDKKLAGAISRSALWSKDSKNPIALVTPIGTMLKLMDIKEKATPKKTEQTVEMRESSVKNSLRSFFPGKEVSFCSISPNSSNPVYSRGNSMVFVNAKAPIFVDGMTKGALETLKEGAKFNKQGLAYNPLSPVEMNPLTGFDGLTEEDFSFYTSGTNGAENLEPLKPQPGGPFGVALTDGDVSVGSLGTVTYREGNLLLGFGHRFLLNGKSDFILTQANVFDTIKSYEASFKLGSIGKRIGSILEDRTQGVLGQVGNSPDLFQTELSVSESNSDKSREFTTDIVKTSNLVGYLSLVTMQESINRASNRVGQGTVKVEYEINGKNMPKPLKRTDIFFSTTEFSYLPSLQVAVFVDALAFNPFKEPDLTNLTADFTVNNKINSGQIIYFALGNNKYSPGDLVAYEVKIKNYRDDIVRKTGAFKLPDNLPSGDYVVTVYGGPRPTNIAPPNPIENFDDFVNYMETLKNYQHLSIELLSPLAETVVPVAGTGYQYESVTRIDKKFPNRVIYGQQAIAIDVSRQKEINSPDKPKDGDTS